MEQRKQYKTIDEYILDFSPEVKKILERLRQEIKETAPNAVEAISYGIPTFKLKGKNLVHFGGFKDHVSFFPTGAGVEAFKDELGAYDVTKGTIHFSLDKPIPYDLVKKITKFRVSQILK